MLSFSNHGSDKYNDNWYDRTQGRLSFLYSGNRFIQYINSGNSEDKFLIFIDESVLGIVRKCWAYIFNNNLVFYYEVYNKQTRKFEIRQIFDINFYNLYGSASEVTTEFIDINERYRREPINGLRFVEPGQSHGGSSFTSKNVNNPNQILRNKSYLYLLLYSLHMFDIFSMTDEEVQRIHNLNLDTDSFQSITEHHELNIFLSCLIDEVSKVPNVMNTISLEFLHLILKDKNFGMYYDLECLLDYFEDSVVYNQIGEEQEADERIDPKHLFFNILNNQEINKESEIYKRTSVFFDGIIEKMQGIMKSPEYTEFMKDPLAGEHIGFVDNYHLGSYGYTKLYHKYYEENKPIITEYAAASQTRMRANTGEERDAAAEVPPPTASGNVVAKWTEMKRLTLKSWKN